MKLNFDKLLKQIGEEIVKEVATEINEKLVKKASNIASDFYGDYTPKYYKRTGGVSGLYTENILKKTGDLSYRVGVKFSSGTLGGHKDPADYLFHGIFDIGLHGTSQIAVMSPSPNKIMEDFVNSL